MIIWEALNNLMDWMNAHGSNDYASMTFIIVIGSIVYNKAVEPITKKLFALAKEVVSDWKVGRQLRKSKEAAH